jgi:hypothetical protein
VVQHFGLSREAAVELQFLLGIEWYLTGMGAEKKVEVAQLACFLFLGYTRALRGEKNCKIELTGIFKYFEEGGTAHQNNVMLSLVGRFKQVEGEQHNFLPVAAVTESCLRIREWVGLMLEEKKVAGITRGFMFRQKDGKVVKAAYFK